MHEVELARIGSQQVGHQRRWVVQHQVEVALLHDGRGPLLPRASRAMQWQVSDRKPSDANAVVLFFVKCYTSKAGLPEQLEVVRVGGKDGDFVTVPNEAFAQFLDVAFCTAYCRQ